MINYGVTHPMKSEVYKKRYDFKALWRKAIATKIRRGTMWRSKPEEECFKQLCDHYGADDIKRHVIIDDHPIDFYIKSINTYIEEDGVYLHGLDRPIETIKQSQTTMDQVIARKWDVDRRIDTWCSDHNLKLARVTDLQVLESNEWLHILT